MSEINNTKLIINISHDDNISLKDLTSGLRALDILYSDFIKDDKQAKFLVKGVREGSIVIDLIANTHHVINGIDGIVPFYYFIKSIFDKLRKYKEAKFQKIEDKYDFPEPTKKDIKNLVKFTGIIGNNNKININIKVQNANRDIRYNSFGLNREDVHIIKRESKSKRSRNNFNPKVHTEQPFKWVQTNHSNSKSGNKALIESLSKKPISVIFETDELKQEMTTSYGGIDWAKRAYTVDVKVQTIEDKIVLYKVVNNYKKDSLPIND